MLVNVFPPGIHVHEIEQGLREVGHDVFTAGLSAPPDPSVPLTKRYPDYRFDLLTTRDTHVNDIVAAAGSADLLLFIEPYIGYVPHAIEECDIPTVFLMGDDPIHADWGQPLYSRCDVGLTSMHSQYQRYQKQGIDHMPGGIAGRCRAISAILSSIATTTSPSSATCIRCFSVSEIACWTKFCISCAKDSTSRRRAGSISTSSTTS